MDLLPACVGADVHGMGSVRSRAAAAPRGVVQSGLPQQDVELLRRLLVGGYLVAAGTAALALFAPGGDRGNTGLLAVALAALAIAVVCAVGRRLPPVVIKQLAFSGAIVLSSALVVVARPLGPSPLYYLWPALTCGHFGTRRDAVVSSALLCVCLAAALPFAHEAQVPVITYVSVVTIFLFVIAGYQRQRARTSELTAELAVAAGHDVLTGLPNRATLAAELPRRLDEADRLGRLLGLVFIDLDGFKAINDGHSHSVGDELLRAVADRLLGAVSRMDLVVRHSGDEFLVLASVETRSELDGVRERVESIYDDPFTLSVGEVRIGGSVGAATYPDEARSSDELLTRADLDMYEMKRIRRESRLAAASRTRADAKPGLLAG